MEQKQKSQGNRATTNQKQQGRSTRSYNAGNFANDRKKASEAGRKGGQASRNRSTTPSSSSSMNEPLSR